MLPSRPWLLACLSTLLAVRADGAGGGEVDGGGARVDARTISGTVLALSWVGAKLTVDTADGPVSLTFDRNTAVFLENRLGSIADLAVGTPLRASYGSDKRAVWVEVRPRATVSATGPDGGSPEGGSPRDSASARAGGPGPGAGQGLPVLPPPPGAGAQVDSADGGSARPATDAGTPAPPPGNAPAGPSPPEPNPGVTPPRPPQPGPSGPGPVPGGTPR